MTLSKISFYFIIISITIIFFSRSISYLTNLNFLNLSILVLTPLIYLLFYWKFEKKFFFCGLILLLVSIISNYINSFSLINLILFLIIILYPFFLHTIFEQFDFNDLDLSVIEKYLSFCFFINLIFSYSQFFLYGLGDEVKGLFLSMGAGHHINGAICFSYAIFLFLINKKNYFYIILNILIVILSDSKQVIVALLLGLVIFFIYSIISSFFSKNKNLIIKNISLNLFFISFLFLLILITVNFDLIYFNESLLNYEYLVGGILKKFNLYTLIELNSIPKILFGNGPGASVSKLAYMANFEQRYDNFLSFLNFSFSELSKKIQYIQSLDWQTDPGRGASSLFQMTFSLGGVLGDIGYLGLISYLYILKKIITDNSYSIVHNLVFFNLIGYGLIFSWLEEPPFVFVLILTNLFLKKKMV